jgi:hypothetical protein
MEGHMPQHRNHDYQRATDPARTNSPTMWTIGAAFFIALLAVLFVYNGADWHGKSGENPPPKNMVTGAGQK